MPFQSLSPALIGKKSSASKPRFFALPAGFSGCAYWRYRLPFQKLQQLGSELDIHIADNANKMIRMQDIQDHVTNADIISIQAPGYKDAYTLMKLYKSEGKKVVVDYDDYSFDLSPGNPRYAELGTKECDVTDESGKVIFRWRDGEHGFDLKANREKYDAFVRCVAGADLVTTTTEYLASKFRQHNPAVAVCPNSIDFSRWKPIPRPEAMKDQVRIGWFGGDSHYVDLKILQGVIPKILRSYPQAKFVIQAPPVAEWQDIFKDFPQDRVEWYGWADLRYYTYFLGARAWDIGLCPLDNNEFNKCKSNIKALEFMALGAAVVAQDMLPYSDHIKHGETGLLAGSENEWIVSISSLIESVPLRNTLAMNGYLDAKERFNLDKNCRIWERNLLDLVGASCGSNLEQLSQPSPLKLA